MANVVVPEIRLNANGKAIPLLGFGTAEFPFGSSDDVKDHLLHAIRLGYRHFDAAAIYLSEQPLGEAMADALKLGLINSREELFITTKLWCSDAHCDHVVPALRRSLENLRLEYVDLYLVHFPVSSKPGECEIPVKEDLLPFDYEGVWKAMEESQRLGLAKSIGVSNFSCKKLEKLLGIAEIPPAVNQELQSSEVKPLYFLINLEEKGNTTAQVMLVLRLIRERDHSEFGLRVDESRQPQVMAEISSLDLGEGHNTLTESRSLSSPRLSDSVNLGDGPRAPTTLEELMHQLTVDKVKIRKVEMNPVWQQQKIREFCKEKGIHITAYSPLGAKGTLWGTNRVMECEVLQQIAKAKGKTIAQVCLRWAYEQGVSVLVKSFNEERMKENVGIFDWSLSLDELKKISLIPQKKGFSALQFISPDGPYKTPEEFWDEEI